MTARPAVSVVVPVYNGAQHLAEAIDSVLAQTFSDFEVILVDDGSSDDSWALLSAYGERDPRVRPHRLGRNYGHHVASNRAIELASGRYVARLDQDDLALPDRLSRTVDAFDANPDVGLVHSQYVRWLPRGERVMRTPPSTDASLRVHELFRNTVCHSTLTIRAEVIDQLGTAYQDLPGPQDYDLIVRALQLTRAFCVPEPLAIYRQSTMAMTGQFSDRMQPAVDAISDRQLVRFIAPDRTDGARRVFSLATGDGDAQYVHDVRTVLDRIGTADPRIDGDELAAVRRHWTAQAMRAAVAPRGGLPRSGRVIADLVRLDPQGAADGARSLAGDLTVRAHRAVLARRLRGRRRN